MTEQEIHNSLKLLKAKRKEVLDLQEQIATERLNKKLDQVLAEYEDLHYKMLNLMDRLPPTLWTVILNRFFRGMSMKMTAEVMEFSVNWVKDIQAEAIHQMSEYSDMPPPNC